MEEYGAKVLIGKILNKPLRITAKIAGVDFVTPIVTVGNTEIFSINKHIMFSTTGKGGTIWVSDSEINDIIVDLVVGHIKGDVGRHTVDSAGIDTLDASEVEFLFNANVLNMEE